MAGTAGVFSLPEKGHFCNFFLKEPVTPSPLKGSRLEACDFFASIWLLFRNKAGILTKMKKEDSN